MDTLKGYLSINRVTSDSTHTFVLTLEDEKSGETALTLGISPENLMLALSGKSDVSCKFEIKNINLAGKNREIKTEDICLGDRVGHLSDAEINALLKPYEIYGWKGDRGDINNPHNRFTRKDQRFVRVNFHRFVDGKGNYIPVQKAV